jgi:hypothetical protein
MNEEREPISFLSYLQAENIRLRQAVADLSFETMALREVLASRRRRSTGPDANGRSPDLCLPLSRYVMLGHDEEDSVSAE